ncbi:MAG: GNAT family N-acetyltransferase [Candidatus Bathyarchaeia archaeon]
MKDLTFHLMHQRDYPLFHKLIEVTGWGLTRRNYERFMSYKNTAGFKAKLGEKEVGMVFRFLYGEAGWIGNLVVLPHYRGQGIGEALMRHVMREIEIKGCLSIRLYSVPEAQFLYKRLGFKCEHLSLRYLGIAKQHEYFETDRMERREIRDVVELDRRFFGYDREEMLRRIYSDHGDLCFTSSSKGKIIGFIMGKEGRDNVRVGPWICVPRYRDHAERLLLSLINSRIEETIWIGVPEANIASRAILESYGFRRQRISIKMCCGKCGERGNDEGVYGIGGPEKG